MSRDGRAGSAVWGDAAVPGTARECGVSEMGLEAEREVGLCCPACPRRAKRAERDLPAEHRSAPLGSVLAGGRETWAVRLSPSLTGEA